MDKKKIEIFEKAEKYYTKFIDMLRNIEFNISKNDYVNIYYYPTEDLTDKYRLVSFNGYTFTFEDEKGFEYERKIDEVPADWIFDMFDKISKAEQKYSMSIIN